MARNQSETPVAKAAKPRPLASGGVCPALSSESLGFPIHRPHEAYGGPIVITEGGLIYACTHCRTLFVADA